MSNKLIKKIQTGEINTLKEVKKYLIKTERIRWGEKIKRHGVVMFEVQYGKQTRYCFHNEENLINSIHRWGVEIESVKILKYTSTNFYANGKGRKSKTENYEL